MLQLTVNDMLLRLRLQPCSCLSEIRQAACSCQQPHPQVLSGRVNEATQAFDLLLQLPKKQAAGRRSCLFTVLVFAVCERPLMPQPIEVLLSLRCASDEVLQGGLLLRALLVLKAGWTVRQQLALQRRKANIVVLQFVHHSLQSPTRAVSKTQRCI